MQWAPALATERRSQSRSHVAAAGPAEAEEPFVFKALPMPSFNAPPQHPKKASRKPTAAKPFSLQTDKRSEERASHASAEAALAEPVFKANPPPKFGKPFVPRLPQDPIITEPAPFQLCSEQRHEQYMREFKLKAETDGQQGHAFRAQPVPATLHKKEPEPPLPPARITLPITPPLASDARASARMEDAGRAFRTQDHLQQVEAQKQRVLKSRQLRHDEVFKTKTGHSDLVVHNAPSMKENVPVKEMYPKLGELEKQQENLERYREHIRDERFMKGAEAADAFHARAAPRQSTCFQPKQSSKPLTQPRSPRWHRKAS